MSDLWDSPAWRDRLFYDRAGRPITVQEWAELKTVDRYVGGTRVGPAWVSTVWLGMDHGFMGPPLIFETVVFGGIDDMEMERYHTEAEARVGHEWWVRRQQDRYGPDREETRE
jgi:hypothetical protein